MTPHYPRSLHLITALTMLLVCSCGKETTSTQEMDAGSMVDAGRTVDAGPGDMERDGVSPLDMSRPDLVALDAGHDGVLQMDMAMMDMGAPVVTLTEVDVTLYADQGASDGAISFALPMKPGLAFDDAQIKVLDGDELVPAHYDTLALWPDDDSLRSVLITLSTDLAMDAQQVLRIQINTPRDTSTDLTGLSPRPDGPVIGVLPAAWYVESRVVTAPMQTSAQSPHQAYETEVLRNLFEMDPAYESYGVSCGSTSSHRTYYDGIRGIYALFLRTGDPKLYRRARQEATWYRDNELLWSDGRDHAYHICQGEGWTPDTPLGWSVLRRMTGQGMLDDYLLSGDPEAKESVLAMGQAFVDNLPALRTPSSNDPHGSIQSTERNLAWTMMGVASAYAISGSQEHRDALVSLMDEVIEWQNRGDSGALEHDIKRPDPSECSDGPAGGSPFMTSLVVDAVMDHYTLVRDARALLVVSKIAQWMHEDALKPNGQTWRYLWNCASNSYDEGGYNDLNLMMVHVYGAAYLATGDQAWIERGDALLEFGLADMFTRRPKQWNQSTRTFGKYLGYRLIDPDAERALAREIEGPVPK